MHRPDFFLSLIFRTGLLNRYALFIFPMSKILLPKCKFVKYDIFQKHRLSVWYFDIMCLCVIFLLCFWELFLCRHLQKYYLLNNTCFIRFRMWEMHKIYDLCVEIITKFWIFKLCSVVVFAISFYLRILHGKLVLILWGILICVTLFFRLISYFSIIIEKGDFFYTPKIRIILQDLKWY